MKKVFLDTNVVLDLILCREPFDKEAVAIFTRASNGQFVLLASPITFSTISYLIRKQGSVTIKAILADLRNVLGVVTTDERAVDDSIKSAFSDFEDAVQYFSAVAGNSDCIVTRNTKDFVEATIPVFTPREFLMHIDK